MEPYLAIPIYARTSREAAVLSCMKSGSTHDATFFKHHAMLCARTSRDAAVLSVQVESTKRSRCRRAGPKTAAQMAKTCRGHGKGGVNGMGPAAIEQGGGHGKGGKGKGSMARWWPWSRPTSAGATAMARGHHVDKGKRARWRMSQVEKGPGGE